MAITEQLRSVARFEYALVRSALTTVDRTILTPLADRSPGVERVVTRARDTFSDLSERLGGTVSTAPSSPPAASRPRPESTPRPKPVSKAADVANKLAETVGGTVDEATDKATDEVEDAAGRLTDVIEQPVDTETDEGSAVLTETEVHEAEGLAEDILETEHVTGELAENEDLREVQARLRAKHALQEQDELHR